MLLSNTSFLLLALVFQRSGTTIILHEAGAHKPYSAAVAVFLGEIVKQALCFFVAIFGGGRDGHTKSNSASLRLPSTTKEESTFRGLTGPRPSLQQAARAFAAGVLNKKAFVLSIPAAIYVLQNNLCLYASANLQPSFYQAAWQLRLVPTALLSHFVLRKRISAPRWLALFGILVGVLALQSAQHTIRRGAAQIQPHDAIPHDNHVTAFWALMTAASLSGLASILLERVFVQKETNLWIANFQLSSFSLVPAAVLLVSECTQAQTAFDPFVPFTQSLWPWAAVILQGMIGILVSLTTKHAGSVVNALAGVASIAVTYTLQIALMSGHHQTAAQQSLSLFGLVTIIACTVYYQRTG